MLQCFESNNQVKQPGQTTSRHSIHSDCCSAWHKLAILKGLPIGRSFLDILKHLPIGRILQSCQHIEDSMCFAQHNTNLISSTMDEFIIKTVKKGPLKPVLNSHLAVNIDANKRARKYPKGMFHIDDGLTFCSLCNFVNHVTKSFVDKHLETVSHKKLAEKQEGVKQKTLRQC